MKQPLKTMLALGLCIAGFSHTTPASANSGYCREYTKTVMIGGRAHEGYGTACQQPDGSWQMQPVTVAGYGGQQQLVVQQPYQQVPQQQVIVHEVPTMQHTTVVQQRPFIPFSIGFGLGYIFNNTHHDRHHYHGRHHGKYKKHHWRDAGYHNSHHGGHNRDHGRNHNGKHRGHHGGRH